MRMIVPGGRDFASRRGSERRNQYLSTYDAPVFPRVGPSICPSMSLFFLPADEVLVVIGHALPACLRNASMHATTK